MSTQIGKIPFEGTASKNVLAFHYYEPERVVMGKKMKDWMRFAMAWWHTLGQALAIGLLMVGGLVLSVWTIVYMRQRGKGNPMDAFGHEVAPRTQHLMTDGPYRLNRNPMLSGTLLYLAGWVVWLWTWQACVVWVAFFAIMFVQVLSEESRLHRDFGEEYEDYCRKRRRF